MHSPGVICSAQVANHVSCECYQNYNKTLSPNGITPVKLLTLQAVSTVIFEYIIKLVLMGQTKPLFKLRLNFDLSYIQRLIW